MGNRIELDENNVDEVVGGALVWDGGVVFPLSNPDCKYAFNSYDDCREFIKNNWTGGPQNEDALMMLEAAGLVYKI